MFRQHWVTALLLLGAAVLAASQSLPGLIDALIACGASQFANFIQSEPDILNLYLSQDVKTVFAPLDSALGNTTLSGRAGPTLDRRNAGLQSTKRTTSLGIASRSLPGADLETNYQAPLLDNRPQRVVVDTRPPNSTSPAKRWMSHSVSKREANESSQPLLRISAGLGEVTNVIKGDIPYDGGLIHVTDRYFTLPQSLSSTSQVTGQTSFASLLSQSNSTSRLDTTHSVTVFLPLNSAFSAANSTVPPSQLISDHVIAGTVSYLPDLKDGTILTTQRGETLSISVRAGRYYVNGGLITQANLILENGVAHVVNKVLKPTPATVVPGSASSNMISFTNLFGAIFCIGMMALA